MVKMDDIMGYRRSHKKIPTKTAMLADQEELARNGAVGKLSEPAGGNIKGRRALSSYRNEMDPIGFSFDDSPTSEPSAKELAAQAAIPPVIKGDPQRRFVEEEARNAARDRVQEQAEGLVAGPMPVNPNSFEMPEFGDAVASREEGYKEDKARYDPFGIREDLQKTWDDAHDPQAKEDRIQRQRAAQEAAVRAAMGGGETGMSGAAALLEGDAGRMAEQQARIGELANDLQLADLGTYLMGFDLEKERYNDAEKQQAAMAAFYLGSMYDMNYDQVMDYLQIPEAARTEEHRNAYNEWHSAEYDPDQEEGSYYEQFENVTSMSSDEIDQLIADGATVLEETRENGSRLVMDENGDIYTDEELGSYTRSDGTVSGDGDSDLIEAINAGDHDDVEIHGDSTSIPDGYVEVGRDDNYIWYYSSEDNEVRKAEIAKVDPDLRTTEIPTEN